jgi:hypothetical protein
MKQSCGSCFLDANARTDDADIGGFFYAKRYDAAV